MKKPNSTIDYFEKHAGEYDEMQPALVPLYDEVLAMVADAYVRYVGEGCFLDLGCGTGNLSNLILKRSPSSRVYILDGSASMLAVARDKIEDASVVGSKAINLEDPTWHRGIPDSLDAVVTSFALEHLKEEDYRSVIGKCHELLRPGGVFISVEWSDDEHGMQSWFVDRMKKQGERLSQYHAAIDEAQEAETHYFVNIRDKLRWIEGAGFKNVHTLWQYLFGYVVVGEK